MAGGYGKRVRRLTVNWVVGNTASAPTAFYVGLSTADPGDAAAGIAEPTIGTGSYARSTSVNGTGSSFWTAAPDPTAGNPAVCANAVAVNFTASSAAWSTGATNLSHFFLSDSTTAVTEATYIARGPITNPTAVNASGITLSFAIGALQLTSDDT